LTKPGTKLFDNDPEARLRLCLADIAGRHADANLVVVTGDLAHDGGPEAYQTLREALKEFPPPTRLLVGNHDDRRNFRACFPDAPVDADGFVQSALDTPVGRLLFLDTTESGTHEGRFCERRRSWLSRQCEAANGGPIYIFMHHPMGRIAYSPMDELGLANRAAFREILRGHDVRHIFAGHVHRPVCGSWNGIPFSTLRGLNHQVWLDFSVVDGIPSSLEPPAYAVILIENEDVIVHFHDFLDRSPKYIYRPALPESLQVTRLG
jgi:3',5'-cyclic AMP phosphodiesterase CpdA